MNHKTASPRVASYLIVRKDDKIALLLRSGTGWMNGMYGLPAGKVEQGESYTQAAIREAKEEIGLELTEKDIEFTHIMHRFEGDDWVDVFFEVVKPNVEPVNAEPHMHSELAWFAIDNLPKNTIPSVKFAVEKIDEKQTFSEFGWVD